MRSYLGCSVKTQIALVEEVNGPWKFYDAELDEKLEDDEVLVEVHARWLNLYRKSRPDA